ncbi:hypothetical protein ACXU4B_12315 [Dyella soli]|uniref:DUF2059 domain-containing protein n=1 Tax=Dyella soli TaxID=522319 RepID=A0A4V2NL21_9GAMM|nr:hypothetical protein [Dyella soli]TCI07068.1 hypothetical protein EZM97_31125 [Dyella soli]
MMFLRRWLVGVVLALACVGGAHAQSDLPDPQGDDVQLRRLLVDFRMVQILRVGVARDGAKLNGTPLAGLFDQLNSTPEETLAEVIAPSLRGHVSEDDARKIGDFLETESGRALTQWMLQRVSNPGDLTSKPPKGNPKEMKAFMANGGYAAMGAFSTYLQSQEFQRKAVIALLHYLTRPEANN